MNIYGYALVTGAGSGIGRDVSLAYAAEGAAGVILADIEETKALAAAEDSRKLAKNPSFEAHAVKVDVSDEASVAAMVNFTLLKFGRIDYCVNSAGVGVEDPKEISETSTVEFEAFWNVNVKGTLLCLREVSRAMKAQEPVSVQGRGLQKRDVGRGVIINLGSCNSYMATPKIVQYTTSKHAVLGMTRNAALDNAPYGIRVNAVCPSWVQTPMVDKAVKGNPDLGPLMQKVIPMGRIAQQEEISDVIMFLSSFRSSYVTGAGWIVDGGTTLSLQT